MTKHHEVIKAWVSITKPVRDDPETPAYKRHFAVQVSIVLDVEMTATTKLQGLRYCVRRYMQNVTGRDWNTSAEEWRSRLEKAFEDKHLRLSMIQSYTPEEAREEIAGLVAKVEMLEMKCNS